jgi:integrase
VCENLEADGALCIYLPCMFIKPEEVPLFDDNLLALHDEAMRLLDVAGKRRLVYLVALETGLSRGELAKVEWRDVHIESEDPFLNVRASTTKNHLPAPIAIDDELAAELLCAP